LREAKDKKDQDDVLGELSACTVLPQAKFLVDFAA
jgi:hypothetical protein